MDIIKSILQLPKQCEQAWGEARKVKVPTQWRCVQDSFKKRKESKFPIKNILVCGMGGSALGAHILQAGESLRVPALINNGYTIPYWADESTLVILISYSGNTEEVLSCAKSAKDKKCKIIGITSGGKLGEWLGQNKCTSYIFDPQFNSTKQPRMGIGYMMLGMMAILDNLKLFNANYTDDIVENAIAMLQKKSYEIQNQAKEFIKSLKGRMPVIFASNYLLGNAHIFANQLNETAKTFSCYFAIPEVNHHLLEGLKHPQIPSIAIFLGSNYSERIFKRFEITKEILEEKNWKVLWYKPNQEEAFAQCLQILLFSSLVSAYLALEYSEDPLSIPTVDYFKKKLG